MTAISVAHSPDSDDHYFFWAITKNRIDTEGLEFSFRAHDTHALNKLAEREECDVVAISSASFPLVATSYAVMREGASVGRNYGPKLVHKPGTEFEHISDLKIGIPGKSTTAANVLRMFLPEADLVEIPIEPYGAMFEALERGVVNALLLIHEGQLEYAEQNLTCVLDIGVWFQKEFHCPLPLGVNVIRRALGAEQIAKVSRVIRRSIEFARNNEAEVIEFLVQLNNERNTSCNTPEKLKRYLALYANDDSVSLKDDVVQGLQVLLLNCSPGYQLREDDLVLGNR